ncbi:transmembrane amino acid transporter protein-domain-containing protein [Aspergillus floccosus]
MHQTINDPNGPAKKRQDDMIELEQCEGDILGHGIPKHQHAKAVDGHQHFHRLGWKRLTIVLIVQSVALGSLSLPSAFATLGMVAGVILTVSFGLLVIYSSYIIGLVKLKYPHLPHYVDFGRLLMGRTGDRIFGVAFVALMTMTVGSHCLTGKLALASITGSSVCALVFSVVSAVVLFALAVPPSFAEIAILGYVDFASILVAIGITMIVTGVQQASSASASWSLWAKPDLTLSEAFVSISNIVFAYSFAPAQPSFMDEMHTPRDFTKSIGALAITQIIIYVLTGAIIYAFVGHDVRSPALLSAGPLYARIAFGLALPVIFISGSINTTVACRFIHGRIYQDSVVRYVNTAKGWISWLAAVALITLMAWIVAEAIPFFSSLLAIVGCLLTSGFALYVPPVMWYVLLREGAWFERRNIWHAISNLVLFIVGIVVLVCGLYATIAGIISEFQSGSISRPFSCNAGN